jgi:hypothetical protein
MKIYVFLGLIVVVLLSFVAGFTYDEKHNGHLASIPLYWYSALTGEGPDEVGLSPGEERPHALPLNNPSFVQGAYAAHMRADDLVVGVVVKGQARAYPWWVVRNHHVINDTVVVQPDLSPAGTKSVEDGWLQYEREPPNKRNRDRFIPLLITLCEACSGASAYIPTVTDSLANPLVFAQCRSEGSWTGDYSAVGVYTVCDMQTHSRWHPFTGVANSGPLKGGKLKRVPVSLYTWQEWLQKYPDTLVVLAGSEMRLRTHARIQGAEMGGENIHPTLRAKFAANPESEDRRLKRNELVMGVTNAKGDKSLAYPLVLLKQAGGVVEHEFDGEHYLYVVAGAYGVSVFNRRYKDDVLTFETVSSNPLLLKDQSATIWNELGEAVDGPHKGAHLSVVSDSYLAEWSEWIQEHEGADVVLK